MKGLKKNINVMVKKATHKPTKKYIEIIPNELLIPIISKSK
tara:strand:+ start:535 stop:657 length:123 start_codon:yes stop_codon:yes gene_type:complete